MHTRGIPNTPQSVMQSSNRISTQRWHYLISHMFPRVTISCCTCMSVHRPHFKPSEWPDVRISAKYFMFFLLGKNVYSAEYVLLSAPKHWTSNHLFNLWLFTQNWYIDRYTITIESLLSILGLLSHTFPSEKVFCANNVFSTPWFLSFVAKGVYPHVLPHPRSSPHPQSIQ